MRKRWNAIIDRMPKDRPIVGIELGVYRGKMSRFLLEALPLLTLYMVDRWTVYTPHERKTSTGKMPKDGQDVFDAAFDRASAVSAAFPDRAIIVRASTDEALELVPRKFDFVFIDADHSYNAVKNDIQRWRKRVRRGGILAGHDYRRSSHPGVTRAVDELFPKGVESDVNGVWLVRM